MAYHFFENYARIDCDLSEELTGKEKKRHQKAYGDLMYLLSERKALVEQYFCAPISGQGFLELCKSLYLEQASDIDSDVISTVSVKTDGNDVEMHLPYSLECRFSEEAISILYHCFVAHYVFKGITKDNIQDLFDSSLSTDIKCFKATRFGYIMHMLAAAGLITNQYQKAIGNCGYIIAPKSDEAMSAASLKQAVMRAKVYEKKDLVSWKLTVNKELNQLFRVMAVDVVLP